jgi:hypothetical protein
MDNVVRPVCFVHHEGHEEHEVGAQNFAPLQRTLRVLRDLRGENFFTVNPQETKFRLIVVHGSN